MLHSLRRTSPKGEDFHGTCVICGETNLTWSDLPKTCANPNKLTLQQAIDETFDITSQPDQNNGT